MKIGDVVPYPRDCNINMVESAMQRRRMTQTLSQIDRAPNQGIAAAKKAVRDCQEREARERDPFERAKTWLRRNGYAPVASLDGVHMVGRLHFKSKRALMVFATMRGWSR